MLEPAALDAEAPRSPRARSSVWTTPAISSPSQATTHRPVSSSGSRERRAEVVLALLAVVPVVAERLALGVEDRPVLVGRDRPDLEAVGQRQRPGCRPEVGTAHRGRSGGSARSRRPSRSARWPTSCSSANARIRDGVADRLARPARSSARRRFSREQRPPDAAAAVRRDGRARRSRRPRRRRAMTRRPRRRRPAAPSTSTRMMSAAGSMPSCPRSRLAAGPRPSAATGSRPRGSPSATTAPSRRSRRRRASDGRAGPAMAGAPGELEIRSSSVVGRHRAPPARPVRPAAASSSRSRSLAISKPSDSYRSWPGSG